MKKQLLKYCRFFKGEEICPFLDEHRSLWEAERNWVDEAIVGSRLLDEYLDGFRRDLPDMANFEVTHPSLKAFLYDRYLHFGGSKSGFPAWFGRCYGEAK